MGKCYSRINVANNVDIKSEKLMSFVTRHARWLVMVRKPKRYYVKPECGLVISPPKLFWLNRVEVKPCRYCRRNATSSWIGYIAKEIFFIGIKKGRINKQLRVSASTKLVLS